jgi:glutathione synthase/RimK-type ligase-like ATP-grasp enzyme
LWPDNEWLLRSQGLSWRIDPDGNAGLRVGEKIAYPVGCVFYRPEPRHDLRKRLAEYVLVPDPALDGDYHEFSRREGAATLLGALAGETDRWVNNPAAEMAADLKLHQLRLAADLGLRVPSTVVTDNRKILTSFWDENGGEVVTKAVSSFSGWAIAETVVTRLVTKADLDRLGNVAPCVTLFQELIPAAYDVRVTLVGDEAFACAIRSQEGDSPIDWRLDQSVPMLACELPSDVISQLQTLKQRLGLDIGGADLRIKPDGTPVFLEINARGAFAFVEARTGLPISKAVASLLLTRAGSSRTRY